MLPVLPVFLDCNNRGGSIRPNPEGWIIENRKAEFFWPLGQNRKAEYDRKAENQSTLISAQYINILSGNWTTYISGLMVKFGLPVFYHFGLMVKNSAFQFSYDSAFRIRPNGPVRYEMDPSRAKIFTKFPNIQNFKIFRDWQIMN